MQSQLPTEMAIAAGSKFAYFPQLVAELRLKIWKHAFPPPRVLGVKFPTYERWHSHDINSIKFDAPLPTLLLHTCHESRKITLETYTKLYPGAYVDWNRDILRVNSLENYMGIQRASFRLRTREGFWGHHVQNLLLELTGNKLTGNEEEDEETSRAEFVTLLMQKTIWPLFSLKSVVIEGRDKGKHDKYLNIELLRDGKTSDLTFLVDKIHLALLETELFLVAHDYFNPTEAKRETMAGISVTFVGEPSGQEQH